MAVACVNGHKWECVMGKIHIGTSGYSYADWRGVFYPKDLPQKEMLQYYTRIFDCVELNFTYYGIPNPRVIAAMVRNTPAGFLFTVKANEATTHKQDPSVLAPFRSAIDPARAAGRLAGVLCQFPWGFKNTEHNRAYLASLAKELGDYRLIVEFRNESWIRPAIFDFLRQHRLAYCSVDEPSLPGLVPRLAKATGDMAYVRFHGRNKAKWFAGSDKERYDYLYSDEELKEFLPEIGKMSKEAMKTYVFFNNCHAGSAAVNATEFKRMLAQLGLLQM